MFMHMHWYPRASLPRIEMAGSRVSFKEVSVVESSSQYISDPEDSDASDHSSSDSDANDFYEITTSEAESLSTSEEDPERLQLALETAFSADPSAFLKSATALDPAERTSLLFLDKDFIDGEFEGACMHVCVCVYSCIVI